jgi:hypothetical protein
MTLSLFRRRSRTHGGPAGSSADQVDPIAVLMSGIVAASAHGRLWPILLKKSFWEGERKFLEQLMRFARGDVRDHIVSSKIVHGLPPSGVEKRRSSREVQRSTFARFLGLFDFRLLQQYPPGAAIPLRAPFGPARTQSQLRSRLLIAVGRK